MQVGDWSEWIDAEVDMTYLFLTRVDMVENGDLAKKLKLSCKFKFKLSKLSEDGKEITLFRTPLYNTWGWAYPEGIAQELIEDWVNYQDDRLDKEEIASVEKTQFSQVVQSVPYKARNLAHTCSLLTNDTLSCMLNVWK